MSKGAPPGVRITQKDLLDAINLDFDEEEEHWNSYTLEDGTTLKVKLVLRGVKRLQRFNPDGTPMYLIQSQNIVRTVNVADALLAKPRSGDRSVKPV
jgi:hypothetical protein